MAWIPFWLCLQSLVLVGDNAFESPFSEPAPEIAVRKIEVPVTFAKVRIENSLRKTLTLFWVKGIEHIEIAPLGNDAEMLLELPEGSYFVQDQDQVRFPVIAAFMQSDDVADGIRTTRVVKMKYDEEWAWIPPGPAVLGDQLGIGADDERCWDIKSTDGFWLQKTEVTNQQYAEFLSAQTRIKDGWIDLESRKCLIHKVERDGKTVYEPKPNEYRNSASMPVVMVSYYGAKAYCNWLSSKSADRYRLPTEQEWEKAARGPYSYVYSYGNLYRQSGANQESGMLKPVACYAPNEYGLFDMTGNVFEWTNDVFEKKPTRKMNQMLRGGSFVLDGMYLRNSFRMRQSASVMTDDIGFRVLREDSE